MLDHFRALGPKFWWIIVVGFTHDLDGSDNRTQAQRDCQTLDAQAKFYLIKALNDEIFDKVIGLTSAHGMWMELKHLYGDSSNWDDGKFKEDHIEMVAHEDVEHDHNIVVVEDCSTSTSNDDDDDHTTRSLDKMDDDATSGVNDDATSCTLDGEEEDGYESDASTCSSTSSHGNTKIHVGGFVVNCDDPNLELLYKLSRALKREMEKSSKLENENSFLKTTCEQQKHLLYVTTCSHEELKLAHEELSVAHDNLAQEHALLTNKLSNEEPKTSESSSFGSNDQSHITTLVV
jgi:hypothetical protein